MEADAKQPWYCWKNIYQRFSLQHVSQKKKKDIYSLIIISM